MLISKLVSADQVRAARALLKWSAHDLAEKAGVHVATINRLEGSKGDITKLNVGTYNNIVEAFQQAGIRFINETELVTGGDVLERVGVVLETGPADPF